MPPTLQEAKQRLDKILKKSRVDFYKPIQIAEVLYRARLDSNVDLSDLASYRNPSIHWRNTITKRFTGKESTSSANYQHDIWSLTAMPPDYLVVLDKENKRLNGIIERYIYRSYFRKQGTINQIIDYIKKSKPKDFQLHGLLQLFTSESGLRRSIDKAYEIVAYSLFETVVVAFHATIRIEFPESRRIYLKEFSDLAKVLLGIRGNTYSYEMPAHIYRVGVTNAADRGLDMWANFGIAIQVKHLTLNSDLAVRIVDQIESDNIVIVCTDADAQAIETITRQIGWGKRVRGIVKESDLINWYEKCLRGEFSSELSKPLIDQLLSSFIKEFPQTESLVMSEFFHERGYSEISENDLWALG